LLTKHAIQPQNFDYLGQNLSAKLRRNHRNRFLSDPRPALLDNTQVLSGRSPMYRLSTTLRAILKNGIALIFASTLLVAAPLAAQVDQGSVTGTVTDSGGAVIPNAAVTLTDNGTGLTLTRATSGSGFYALRR
jgi:hypothetical protein